MWSIAREAGTSRPLDFATVEYGFCIVNIAVSSAGSMVDAVSATEYFDVVDRITIDPNQCGGRPCIRGMRIRVRDVLDMLAEGATEQEILKDYPDLEAEDIRASLAYAARYFDHPVLVNS